jgi:hypothetical protein
MLERLRPFPLCFLVLHASSPIHTRRLLLLHIHRPPPFTLSSALSPPLTRLSPLAPPLLFFFNRTALLRCFFVLR